MKYTKKEIMELIRKVVFEVTRNKVESDEMSLLDTSLSINPADFLYIFDLLEKELGVPAVEILKDHDYTVMKIGNMSEALLGLIKI